MSTYQRKYTNAENPDYSIVIDDDGVVAYAYLLFGNTCIGDVWLYNQAEPPAVAEWDKTQMPFLNPKEFITDDYTPPITNENEVDVIWVDEGDLMKVNIFIRGEHVATALEGAKPGWSIFVKKDGPLAKKMNT